MIKRYNLPIYGKLLSKEPPVGDENNPVQPISLYMLPDPPEDILFGKYTDMPVKYDFNTGYCEVEVEADESVHDWLKKALDAKEDEKLVTEKNLTLDTSAVEIET